MAIRRSHRQNAFNAGELSPRLKGRADLEKYQSGLARCLNALVLPHGGVCKRPALQYINDTKHHEKVSELIPFEFSEDQSYVLEFGDFYMRVFMDGGRVVSPDSNTKLLLHCDGIDGSINFLDSGYTGHTIIPYGNAQVDTEEYAFATGSAKMDGDGDYLSIASHADWNYGTGNVTIDLRVRFDVVNGVHLLYFRGDGASVNNYVALYQDHEMGKLCFTVRNTTRIAHHTATWAPVIETWYHVALVRGWDSNPNDWALTVNGTAIATWTESITMPSHSGALTLGGGFPATAEMDMGATGHAITLDSGAVISSAASKFGIGSLFLDGNDDNATIPDSADFEISANWTVDCFVKMGDHIGTETVICHFEDATHCWALRHIHGTGFQFEVIDGSQIVVLSGGEITDDDWHHVALCKVGNDYYLYLDGTQTATVSDSDTATRAGSLQIGKEGGSNYFYGNVCEIRIAHSNIFSAGGGTITVPTARAVPDSNTKLYLPFDWKYLDGWIDEYRVSNVARWTETFSIPVQEYPGGGGGIPCEISTPYSESDVQWVRTVQSADTLYLFHPSWNTYKVTRQDHDVWDITEVDWDEPPWNEMNDEATHTLTPSAMVGTMTVTASWNFFSELHVGAYFSLHDGFVRIISVTDATHAIAVVKSDLSAVTATADWCQGCWDDTQGYPTMGCFHEDRLFPIGDLSHPLTVFGSKNGYYETMGPVGSGDTDPLQLKIWSEKQNLLKWIISGKRLFMGSVGAEFWITGAEINLPITPTSVLTRRESTYGGIGVSPVMIGSDVIFVQKGGKKLRSWNYDTESDSFDGADLTILAEHLTKSATIDKMQYAQDPNGIIWCLLSDGHLMGLTYLKDHKVVGFHDHTTGSSDEFESIAVIPGLDRDELWAVVKRTVNGSTKRYIERMAAPFFGGDLDTDAFYVDSGLSYSGSPATSFVGMDHMEGEVVQVFADGLYVGTKTISGGGFTLSTAASNVHAGLGYNMDLQFLIPDIELDKGHSGNKLKRIVELVFQVFETGSFYYGRDTDNLIDMNLTTASLTTSELLREFNGEHQFYPSAWIRQDEPLPFTLLSLISELEIEDD